MRNSEWCTASQQNSSIFAFCFGRNWSLLVKNNEDLSCMIAAIAVAVCDWSTTFWWVDQLLVPQLVDWHGVVLRTSLRSHGKRWTQQVSGDLEAYIIDKYMASMIFLLISWDMWSYQEVKLTTQFERFLRVVSKIATLKPPWCVKRFGCFEACERYEEFPPGHVFDSKSVALWHVEIS